jgi:hypothetical protein
VTYILGSFRMPGIVSGLHPGPDSCAIAKKFAEPHCNGCRHRLSFLQDVVKMLARYPEQFGDFRLGSARGRNNFIAEQRAGMGRAAVLAALCRMDHVRSSQ